MTNKTVVRVSSAHRPNKGSYYIIIIKTLAHGNNSQYLVDWKTVITVAADFCPSTKPHVTYHGLLCCIILTTVFQVIAKPSFRPSHRFKPLLRTDKKNP